MIGQEQLQESFEYNLLPTIMGFLENKNMPSKDPSSDGSYL